MYGIRTTLTTHPDIFFIYIVDYQLVMSFTFVVSETSIIDNQLVNVSKISTPYFIDYINKPLFFNQFYQYIWSPFLSLKQRFFAYMVAMIRPANQPTSKPTKTTI